MADRFAVGHRTNGSQIGSRAGDEVVRPETAFGIRIDGHVRCVARVVAVVEPFG